MILNRRRLNDLLIVSVTVLITAVALFQLNKVVIDGSAEVFVPDDNPVSLIMDEIKSDFGSQDNLIIGLETKYTSVLEPDILNIINEITLQLESFPAVEQVISLTNIDYIQATSEGMEVLPLLEGSGPEDFSNLNARLNSWPEMYYGTVISKDHSFAAIVIRPEKTSVEEDHSAICDFLIEQAERYENENISFALAGAPVLKNAISRSIFQDLIFLVPLVAAAVILVLAFSFRKPEGILFPLISLALACIWVMGLIGLLGITFTMATFLVPVLLLVVGSAYGIHIMTHFYEEVGTKTERISYSELTSMLKDISRRIRLSVILAGVTTAAGFLSQLFCPLRPFKMFGLLSAAGIFFALLLTFLLIPALIRLRFSRGIDPARYRSFEERRSEKSSKSSQWIPFLEKTVYQRKRPVLILTAAVFTVTFIMIPRISIGTNLIEFFSSDSQMVKDTGTFNQKLNGTGIISIVLDAPEKGDVLAPSFLKQLEHFEQWLPQNAHQVSAVQTVIPAVKRMNMIMNADRVPYESSAEDEAELDFFADGGLWGASDGPDSPESGFYEDTGPADDFVDAETFNEIPTEPEKYGMSTEQELHDMLTQFMIMYSDSLEMMLNDALEPDRMLVTVRLTEDSSRDVKEVINIIEEYWDYFIRQGWTYKIAGNSAFYSVLTDLVARSQVISLSISLVFVWIIMIALFRSIKTGTIGMIPVFFALAGMFSFMVMLGFNLDIITALLAALAVGVGVDYSIHFMTAYMRESSFGNHGALTRVYRTTGRAILFNAVSVTLGFLCLLGSRFIPIRQLGILFAVAMVFAAFSALVVLPAVIVLFESSLKEERV